MSELTTHFKMRVKANRRREWSRPGTIGTWTMETVQVSDAKAMITRDLRREDRWRRECERSGWRRRAG
jgi:hypothetical protein